MTQSVVARETEAVRSALATVEDVERVVHGVPLRDGDPHLVLLYSVIERTLQQVSPVRPKVAAEVLGLTDKTVRRWLAEGVLINVAAEGAAPRLDLQRVHEVLHLVEELRTAGQTRNLIDAVWRRLSDQALVESGEFQESLNQMRRGEGVARISRAAG